MAKFLSWKVKWMRVWNLSCPFIFCNIVCWLWVWYFFPAKSNIYMICMNNDARHCSEISRLKVENRDLKKKYVDLHSEAKEKLSYAYGRKAELYQQLQEWQTKAVDLEIQMASSTYNWPNYNRKTFFAPTLQDEKIGVELEGEPIPLRDSTNDRQKE